MTPRPLIALAAAALILAPVASQAQSAAQPLAPAPSQAPSQAPSPAPQDPPAAATPAPDGWLPEIPGLDAMTGAAREALEALRAELGPALRKLRDAVALLDDYGPPEMLPNGDILIPRRQPAPESGPDGAPPAGPEAPPDEDGRPTIRL